MCSRQRASEFANHVATPEQGLPEVAVCEEHLLSLLFSLLLWQLCVHCSTQDDNGDKWFPPLGPHMSSLRDWLTQAGPANEQGFGESSVQRVLPGDPTRAH